MVRKGVMTKKTNWLVLYTSTLGVQNYNILRIVDDEKDGCITRCDLYACVRYVSVHVPLRCNRTKLVLLSNRHDMHPTRKSKKKSHNFSNNVHTISILFSALLARKYQRATIAICIALGNF